MVNCVSTAMESDARARLTCSFGFDLLLEDVDVVLKFAREKFADLLVDAIHVGNQGQQTQQQNQRESDRSSCGLRVCRRLGCSLLASRAFARHAIALVQSIRLGSFNCLPQAVSLRAISP